VTQPTAQRKPLPICADCKTRPASLKRGKENVCPDCYNETPLQPLAQWDRVTNPAYILAMESQIDKLTATVDRLVAVIASLQETITDRTADS